ncbi:MAG: glycosyltransferase family 4 protein, partial [Actinomycetia bacterium]|nr:glycosyltransferase family 4 protein [Actinomycetes bacterium]
TSSQAIVELVPVGVPAKSSPSAFSNQLRSPSLVVAGELTPDAGVETLLHAVKRVLPHHPTLAVFVIGKGPTEQSLRHLANALGIGLHVTFTGRLEHWRTAMEAADIFCLPGLCNVFREEPLHALATGLAIVASEDSPYEELANEETALLFPPGNIEKLADQLRALLDNPERARIFAATAQAQARSCHSASRMIADHVRIYNQVAVRNSSIPIVADR